MFNHEKIWEMFLNMFIKSAIMSSFSKYYFYETKAKLGDEGFAKFHCKKGKVVL